MVGTGRSGRVGQATFIDRDDEDRCRRDRANQDRANQDRANQDRANQDRDDEDRDDEDRANQDRASIDVLVGDWRELRSFGPFDLLVLDGGGHGKNGSQPADPAAWLRPGGLLVVDDFTPSAAWPPLHNGEVDRCRLHWLNHPRLRATQINVAPDATTVVGTYTG